ncbi:hypothetical protein JRG18_12580 [Kocuria palustris]|uniref:hypothetical protein n=1 Tax=Kocuria palustris TaxID=71999 RepID=UPI0019D1A247|nr:hypothetical protein [Kocuria palustris]MBN6754336.1 hypothetical protein [Kocuria palustris]MBN6759289.1 hypothetical protein [Kocuria palustris]MBN6764317.1 hypothetical protein [Kocuria palustris]MBN6783800.1 hypothetical protein [Kocuria palustris]MBN6800284.1 hypothetical protein [Kocuria palustris]
MIDGIASLLAAPEWSGAQMLEIIAEAIGRVRPHPGAYPDREAYSVVFTNETGRLLPPDPCA